MAVQTLSQPGRLEIIDPRGQFLAAGTIVTTTLGDPSTATPVVASPVAAGPVYQTLISNTDIAEASVIFGPIGTPVVAFTLTDPAADRFFAYTSAYVGRPLSLVLDKRVVSSPVVNDAISGEGIVEGLSLAEAEALAIQLNTRPLPAPVAVVRVALVSPDLDLSATPTP